MGCWCSPPWPSLTARGITAHISTMPELPGKKQEKTTRAWPDGRPSATNPMNSRTGHPPAPAVLNRWGQGGKQSKFHQAEDECKLKWNFSLGVMLNRDLSRFKVKKSRHTLGTLSSRGWRNIWHSLRARLLTWGECLIKGITGKVLSMYSDYKHITASEGTAWWWERDLSRLADVKEWIRASCGSTVWSEDCLQSIYTSTPPGAELLFHEIQHICSDTWTTPLPRKQEGKDGNEEDQVEIVTE